MTNHQYRAALKKLGLRQEDAARVLGISRRTANRYAAGDTIPNPVAKLVRLMERDIIAPADVEALQ